MRENRLVGSSPVLWTPNLTTGPVTSFADALERALDVPGVVAVVLGDLTRGGALALAQHPDYPVGFAHQSAYAALAYARAAPPDGEVPDELVLTGAHHVSLQHTKSLPTATGHAFVHLTLRRPEANLALARLGLSPILDGLPALVAQRRPSPTPPPTDPPPGQRRRLLDRLRPRRRPDT
ncbi:hypothetical protein [Streptacidiphilus melanogenes]|uniref:hypothetical protein n=1 Tax=Streptacidiphilus melanogenes TaxID=411235 RepID=UPI0005A7A337|nr:hypothetical protein [Streptacidiphilus melanogenes]